MKTHPTNSAKWRRSRPKLARRRWGWTLRLTNYFWTRRTFRQRPRLPQRTRSRADRRCKEHFACWFMGNDPSEANSRYPTIDTTRGNQRESDAGVALFFPRGPVGMVAVAFPEAETVFVEQNKTAHPLDAFPGVEVRNDEADRAAVLGSERNAIVIESEENVGTQQILERNRS